MSHGRVHERFQPHEESFDGVRGHVSPVVYLIGNGRARNASHDGAGGSPGQPTHQGGDSADGDADEERGAGRDESAGKGAWTGRGRGCGDGRCAARVGREDVGADVGVARVERAIPV